VFADADRQIYTNDRFLGAQDTLIAWSPEPADTSRQYYSDDFIQGAVDFLCGDATDGENGNVAAPATVCSTLVRYWFGADVHVPGVSGDLVGSYELDLVAVGVLKVGGVMLGSARVRMPAGEHQPPSMRGRARGQLVHPCLVSHAEREMVEPRRLAVMLVPRKVG
jgi:hypothetical protein